MRKSAIVIVLFAGLCALLPNTMLNGALSQSALAESFDIEAATADYLSVVSPEEEANTNGYVNAGYKIMVISVIFEIVVALALLQFGFARRWRELAERVTRVRVLQSFIFVPIYVVVTAIIGLPLAWYSGFVVEHKYGLSNLDLGSWFNEHLISMGFSLVALTIFLTIAYMVIRATKERWWMWGSGLMIMGIMISIFLGPLYIDPAFNEYRPMDEGPLKERILSIARANGMEADDVKQVDASKQTKRVSANVSGLFGSSRIALNDNLIIRTSPDGVEAVMAHEIGHFVLSHIWKMMAMFAVLFFLGFAFVGSLFNRLVKRHGGRWGVRDVDDLAGLPLLLAAISVLFFITTPFQNRITYINEVSADLFAINATQNPDAWAEVALLTAEYRKLRPSAWEENWLNHHPSPYARIHMAMVWKAEQVGKTQPSSSLLLQPEDNLPEDETPPSGDGGE